MLGIGWPELLIIAVVTVVAVGPQELPKVLRTVMTWTRKLRKLANEFQTGMEDLAREAELHELTKDIEKEVSAVSKGVTESVEKDMAAIEKEMATVGDDVTGSLEQTTKEISATEKEFAGTFRVYDQYDEMLNPGVVAGTSVFVPAAGAGPAKDAAPAPLAEAATAPAVPPPAAPMPPAMPAPAVAVAEAERITPEPVAPPAPPRRIGA